MHRRPPESTRCATLLRYTTLFRSIRQPLVAAGGPADRGADPAGQAVRRHRRGRTAGVRDRTAAAAEHHDGRRRVHRAAAGAFYAVAARACVPAVLRGDAADVPADADTQSRPATRDAAAEGGPAGRLTAAARRAAGRGGERGVPEPGGGEG